MQRRLAEAVHALASGLTPSQADVVRQTCVEWRKRAVYAGAQQALDAVQQAFPDFARDAGSPPKTEEVSMWWAKKRLDPNCALREALSIRPNTKLRVWVLPAHLDVSTAAAHDAEPSSPWPWVDTKLKEAASEFAGGAPKRMRADEPPGSHTTPGASLPREALDKLKVHPGIQQTLRSNPEFGRFLASLCDAPDPVFAVRAALETHEDFRAFADEMLVCVGAARRSPDGTSWELL